MQAATALLELLLPTLLAATPTRAPEAVLRASTPARTVEIEIVEKPEGGKRSRSRLELPANGKLEAWVESGARRRECKLASRHDASRGELVIDLRCRDQGTPDELAVWAQPSLVIGKRSILAKIERPDGGSTEVSATLR